MKRWKQWIRLAVIAGASFVLLVTVLPQVASGIGLGPLAQRLASSPGCSSGGTSSICAPGGTVLGTVTITGRPTGFTPAYRGAGACPDSGPAGMVCADPIYALTDSTGHYHLSLTVGKWRVAGFYEDHPLGGAFLGTSKVVSVSAGQKIVDYVAVAYQKAAAIKGTITVTGVPAGVQVEELSVLLCPSFAPFNGTFPSIACVNAYSGVSRDSGSYGVTGLPPGTWTAYPSFCPLLGEGQYTCLTNDKAGKRVTLVGGSTSTDDLATPFLVPGYGLFSGKITVTGTPTGFSDPVAVMACQKSVVTCQTTEVSNGADFKLLLGDGTWSVNGLYLAAPFYNAIVGPTETVTVASGHTTTLDVTAPYKVPGGATGTITVTGAPAGVAIQSYTMLACPASSPLTGALALGECVTEYSGPGGGGIGVVVVGTSALSKLSHPRAVRASQADAAVNSYELSTLTAGTWILYPGYQTEFGSATDPVGTRVTVTAGGTTDEDLSVPYQVPTVGAVTGSVDVVGAPENTQAGVEACTTAPTTKVCTDEQGTYINSDGTYRLTLTPGTWWVTGYVDLFDYNGPGLDQTNATPVKVTVTAGTQTTEDFTVVVSS
jgi:hypothetical protein